MGINPSTYDTVLATCTAIIAIALLTLAYRLHTNMKQRWKGTFLYYYSRERTALSRYLAALGILSGVGTVGNLLYSNTINGFTELGLAAVVAYTYKLHQLPRPVGVIARTPKGRVIEFYGSLVLAGALAISGILNLVYHIHA